MNSGITNLFCPNLNDPKCGMAAQSWNLIEKVHFPYLKRFHEKKEVAHNVEIISLFSWKQWFYYY